MMRLQLSHSWHIRRHGYCALVTLLFLSVFTTMSSQSHAADFQTENDPLYTKSGSLVICGGGVLPHTLLDRFIELGGGPDAHVVIIPSASVIADTDIHARMSGWYDRLADNGFASLQILHTRSRMEADDENFSQILDLATAVWFIGGNQNWLAQTYVGTRTEERLHNVLARGGVIGGTSAGAAIMSRSMIADGKVEPLLSSGLGFLPGTIVDQHFKKRNRQERLMRALQLRPGMVGFGIDEGTALIVQGRSLEVIGESDVSICLSPSTKRPARIESLTPGHKADLIALKRAANSRVDTLIASTDRHVPDVQNGTLVIAGGGPTPKEVIDSFLEAAGGIEAPIVVVSNALGDYPPEQREVCGWLQDAGARNVTMLHARSGEELSSPSLIALLKAARGVWFTGGRQWRLVDAYMDTNVEELFHDVLRRGGVIGGTSAGATIQGEYLVRGNPLGNEEIMCEGYDRGFGFLPGVAIDQHFTERKRHNEMVELKKTHPELIGLGVDESTALIVRGSTMQVVGKHQVTVFDSPTDSSIETPEFAILKSGDRYDLRQHRRVETALAEADTPK
ncbi:cyanophycinase [Schlesneria sp. T3-172]|uniref:cyanophycinase n=1 Tax=Schlesneria sphaerica TaxID=3373610 RepID=UPI0037C62743